MKQAQLSGPKQRSALQGKSCQLIIAVAALFFSLTASSQTRDNIQRINTPYSWIGGEFRKLLYVPLDTASTADSGCVAYVGGRFYLKKSAKWIDQGAKQITDSSVVVAGDTIVIRGTGGGVDTTSLSNRINNKADQQALVDSSIIRFRQGGNSFGAEAIAGTNDNNAFSFETNALTRMTISNAGLIGINTAPLSGFQLRSRGLPTRLSSLQIDSQSVFSGNPAGISLYGRTIGISSGAFGVGILEYSFPTLTVPGWRAYIGVQSWAYIYGASPQQPGTDGGQKFRNYINAFSGSQVYDNNNTTLHFQLGYFSALNNQNGTIHNGADFYASDYNSVLATTNNDSVLRHYAFFAEPFTYSSGGTQNWGVFIKGTQPNYFAGNVGIGDSLSTERLDVNGRVRIRTIDAGDNNDSSLVISGGVVKGVDRSTIGIVRGTMSGDGGFTIAENIGLQRLIDITANRTVTMPTPTEGRTLVVWNANTGAFAWNISGSVVNAAGTALTTFVNDTTYTLIGTGSEWLILAVH